MPLHAARGIPIELVIALIQQYWPYVIIIVGVLLLAYLTRGLWPVAKIKTNPSFSTDTTEAADLALGYLAINEAGGLWNDPTASHLNARARERRAIVDRWHLTSSEEWRASIDGLLEARLQRPLWVKLLAIRRHVVAESGDLGRKAWLDAIRAAGGTGKGEERVFVDSVLAVEKGFRGVTNSTCFPKGATVTTFDGYALNLAVAVATWGVSLGIASREEAAARIAEAGRIARSEFTSWDDYGRSVVIGRAMHLRNGHIDDNRIKEGKDAAITFLRAMNPKANGPWASLPWRR